jgi:hypothetical protein
MTDSSLVEGLRFGGICTGKMKPELEEDPVEDSVKLTVRKVPLHPSVLLLLSCAISVETVVMAANCTQRR